MYQHVSGDFPSSVGATDVALEGKLGLQVCTWCCGLLYNVYYHFHI